MADDNFMANQKLLGNCVHEIKILLFAKIRRMARIVKERNDRIVFPLGRAPDLGSFFASLF
jgi:hypothetical protein